MKYSILRLIFAVALFGLGSSVRVAAQSNVDGLAAQAYAAGRAGDYSVACVIMGDVFLNQNNNFNAPIDQRYVSKDIGKWQASGKAWCEQAMERESLCEPKKLGRANEICAPASDYNSCMQRLGYGLCGSYKRKGIEGVKGASGNLNWLPGSWEVYRRGPQGPLIAGEPATDDGIHLTIDPTFFVHPRVKSEVEMSVIKGKGNPLDKFPKLPGKIYPSWDSTRGQFEYPSGFITQWNKYREEKGF